MLFCQNLLVMSVVQSSGVVIVFFVVLQLSRIFSYASIQFEAKPVAVLDLLVETVACDGGATGNVGRDCSAPRVSTQ